MALPEDAREQCDIDGCTSPVRSYGWCTKHYTRWYRHGYPTTTRRHGLKRHLADGCMCGSCRLRHVHVLSMRNRWVAGETLAEIGHDYDLSRERVRQLIELVDPDRWEKRRRRRRLHDLWERNVKRAQRGPCPVCGRRVPLSRIGHAKTCSDQCSEWNQHSSIRGLVDEEFHASHLRHTHRWAAENLPAGDSRRQLAERRLDGEPPTHNTNSWMSRDRTRWVIEGSEAWDYCLTAMRNGWPCVEWWPEDVRAQIAAELDGADVT